MIYALLLFMVGILLSAFFSGTETGFYRATRVRIRLDAISGDLISQWLIRLANRPALFVATVLIGNNIANYLTSFAIVLGSATVWPAYRDVWGTIAPIALSPVVFVYGELLPKNLFFQAPNRLFRLGGPFFLVCSIILLPASLVLWLLARTLRLLVGEAPEQVRLSLARQELQRVFDEGHEVGILRPAQQRLAQGMLSLANEPLVRFSVPVTGIGSLHLGVPKAEVFRMAKRNQLPLVLVTEKRARRVLGYARLLDLKQDDSPTLDGYRELLEIDDSESPVSALMTLQSLDEPIARVVNGQGVTLGLLSAERLVESFSCARP